MPKIPNNHINGGLLALFCLSLVITSCTANQSVPKINNTVVNVLETPASLSFTVGDTHDLDVSINNKAALASELGWMASPSGIIDIIIDINSNLTLKALATGKTTLRVFLKSDATLYKDIDIIVSDKAVQLDPIIQQVLDLTNAARASARYCGTVYYVATTPLSYNTLLEKSASGHAQDMASKNYFSHESQDGRTFLDRVNAVNYFWLALAENIAGGQATPENLVENWLSSPEHCKNIMNANLKEIGIGYSFNQNSTYKHYWVQDFGVAP